MSLELPYGIKRLDTSSNVDDMYGYYNSIQDALTNIVPGLRKGGRTVGIKQDDGSIVEYWWENDNDLSDAGLKLKSFNNSESLADGFITLPNTILDGNDITIEEGLEWRINGIIYELSSDWEDTIPFTNVGFTRKDIIVATNTGTLLRIEGEESDTIPFEPTVPPNTLLVTSIDVFNDIIGEPTEPVVGDIYVKKAGFTSFVFTGTPGSQVFKGITETSKNLFIHPSSPGQGVFSGFLKTPAYNLYDGLFLHVENRRATSVMVRNKSTSTPSPGSQFTYIKFDFRDNDLVDYEMKPGEVLTFVLIGDFAVLVCSNMPVGSGGVSGDYIPLSGTEVGKPLTGNIEVDTSNDRVGFYSEDNDRFIGLTDDGYNSLIASDSSGFSELAQHPEQNVLRTQNNEGNASTIMTESDNISLTNVRGNGNAGILSIDSYQLNFSSDMDSEFLGTMYYNAEEGLGIRNENNGNFCNYSTGDIIGQVNGNGYSIMKDPSDDTQTRLVLPDSGVTSRRIPVSVNGVYANQQGEITIPTGSGLPESEEGKFLVGGASDWEKRNITRADVTSFTSGLLGISAGNWYNYQVSTSTSATSIPLRTASPNPGRLKANNAIETDDLVPLSQLNSRLDEYVPLTGNQTVSGVKTFTSSPIVPTATTSTQAVNLGQVNGIVGGAIQDLQKVIETGGVANTDEHISIKTSNSMELLSGSNMTIATVGEEGSVAITSPYLLLNNSIFPVEQGSPNQVLATNGAGQLSWATIDYVNAGTDNITGGSFSLDKLVIKNSDTDRRTTFTKPNYDPADSNITIPSFGGGTKVMPISVNGVSAGPSGDISLTLDIDKFIGVTLGGSSTLINVNFAAGNPDITGYEEIEIGIQFLGKTTTTTDFYITFNSNTNPVYNSTVVDSSGTPTSFTNQSGFRFKYDSENGFYTFKVKNYMQAGIPRIITGSGVEFGDSTDSPKTWTFGGGFNSDANITTLQIKSVDGSTNVPYMRVTVKRIF